MSNVGSVVNYFSTANEGFATTLANTISSGATTIPLASVAGLTDGSVFVGIIEPGQANQQVFTGTVSVSGADIINVVWTRSTNNSHIAGVIIVDYVTGTDWNMAMTGIGKHANQDGSLTTAAVQKALNITGGAAGGWTPSGFAPSTVAYNGNRSYTLTFSGNDVTPTLSKGMRLQMTRTVTAPSQCTSLNGSTQYYSKSSPAAMTFTDDFVVSAWIKLTSYVACAIASRYNGTSGWNFTVSSTGQLQLEGFNAGASNFSYVISAQSLPLNRWVHVAAQLDMSAFTATPTTSYIMIDGVDVPASVARGGSDPTALIQAGSLEIGSQNSGSALFPGKIAQVAIYNAHVTEATIAASSSQTLAGTETSLVSAYSFNNAITDLNANANNLTTNGSAVATNADTPFAQTNGLTGYAVGTTNYGIITAISFSTNTTCVVQVPEGDTIPTSGGISGVSYATSKTPYGFPAGKGKWRLGCFIKTQTTQSSPTQNTWYNMTPTSGTAGGSVLNIPIGDWMVGYDASSQMVGSTNTIFLITLSTANNTESDSEYTHRMGSAGANTLLYAAHREKDQSLSAATSFYLNNKTDQTGGTSLANNGNNATTVIYADCALL